MFSASVVVQYIGRISRVHQGDIMIHVRGYHEYIEGYTVRPGFQYEKAFIN